MALELRPSCECCDRDLPPDSPDAMICSFECTFCTACAAERLPDGCCPNCGGELIRRPVRPPHKLATDPPSARRVLKAHPGCAGARRTIEQGERRAAMTGTATTTAIDIGFLIFPGVTQLDFTGPLQVLARVPQARVHTIAKRNAPVASDCGLRLLPDCTFEGCPPLDLICVPGGGGVVDAARDGETLDFVRRQAARARYVTSVCTGAFVLGAAGLLKGKRAATHWAYTDLLPLVGAIPAKARVVRDGNLFTAGGVTSGIDFGLTVAAELTDETVAQSIQLGLEYDPAPPFDAGHPDRAPAAAKAGLDKRYARSRSAYREAVLAALREA